MKRCSKCGVEKDKSEFYKAKGCEDGLRGECKTCVKVRNRAYVVANREKTQALQKTWREAHREKAKCYHKVWREANREKLRGSQRAWKEANREKFKHYQRTWLEAASDTYVKQLLRLKDAPAELIEAKREQLKMYRAVKQLQEVLKDAAQPKQENDHE